MFVAAVAIAGASYGGFSRASAQGDSVRARPLSGSIDGLVTDSALAPVDDVTISVVGTAIKVVTGLNGQFRILALPVGRHRVLARRIGHEPALADVVVSAGEQTRLVFVLEPLITALPTARVEGIARKSLRLEEFDQRRKLGEGQFLTLEQIDKRNVVAVQDLLAGFRGIRSINGLVINTRFPINQTCPLEYYVDGLPRPRTDLPSPKEIAGLELYLGPATMPPQFKRTTGTWCGVVLLWMKDGTESYPPRRSP
jgi:hypothetical protein